ncbi:MAG: hypothetical protein DAHOPDDO_01116 [Ignavibacteriaceae bacterium]|jgi:hypothetical protein|nr:hypothetical protein [Ignavibacteriaceae bacterium]
MCINKIYLIYDFKSGMSISKYMEIVDSLNYFLLDWMQIIINKLRS